MAQAINPVHKREIRGNRGNDALGLDLVKGGVVMPKFNIEVTFALQFNAEPYGYLEGVEYESDVADYEEQSSWYGETVSLEGGVVSFVLEADDEDEATGRAQEMVENATFSDDRYEVVDVTVQNVERVEEELDLASAIQVIKNFLARMIAEGRVDDQTGAAFTLVLEALSALSKEPEPAVVGMAPPNGTFPND
jgi:hypothetical protein